MLAAAVDNIDRAGERRIVVHLPLALGLVRVLVELLGPRK